MRRLLVLVLAGSLTAAVAFAVSRRVRGARHEHLPAAPLAPVCMAVGDHAPAAEGSEDAIAGTL